MTDLETIETSLIKMQNEFNSQLSAMDKDSKEFHKSIINLSAKYPNHKELIEFIVQINDRIETKQSIFSDIIVDSFNDMIEVKHQMLRKMIMVQTGFAERKKEELFKNKIKNKFKNFDFFSKNNLTFVGVCIVFVGLLFFPDYMLDLLKKIIDIWSAK